MNIGDEGFHPVSDELHGPAQHDAEANDRHVFVIDVQFHPEGAADIRCDDAHASFAQTIVTAIEILELIRGLRRVMNGQTLFARIIVRDDGPRLQSDRRVAAECKGVLNHRCGCAEGLIHHAGLDLELKGNVPPEFRIDEGGILSACGINIGYRLKFLELDDDQLKGIFRLRARLRNDRHDWLSGPNHLANG